MSADRPRRVVIENLRPQVDGGRFPIKRAVGETVTVTADIFADGHDLLAASLLYRCKGCSRWQEVPMTDLGNDAWRAEFITTELGRYQYTVQGWIDRFASWRRELSRQHEAGQAVASVLLEGAAIVRAAAQRATTSDGRMLSQAAAEVAGGSVQRALDPELQAVVGRHAEREELCRIEPELEVVVDRERARFSAWYEMFPRSCTGDAARPGRFRDCEQRLEYVAEMGFDVLYLPPIHPIGAIHRKGRNNNPVAAPEEVGSPWAIGSHEGGHTAVHPDLGTLDDFRWFVARAAEHGLEVALDLAYQCTPDHPWVREHPEWFHHRPDGTIKYAENPPKKYEDIYPLQFECAEWRALWAEMKSVVEFWIEQGVRIFRVDNPHTKPFDYWEWMIGDIKARFPDVIFLSEAFTRPKIMYRLAKLGFTQSYTYFAWRNAKWELERYFTELTQTDVREFFRPNLWPNTPDILTEYMQTGGRPAFMTRLVLAATLGASYGIYGPAFELAENRPLIPGKEEYLDSEKYQVRLWDVDRADSLSDLIGRVNRIRRENPAMQGDHSLVFHRVDNDQLIAYSKNSADASNVILVVVNLDFHYKHSGWTDLRLDVLGIAPDQPFEVHDLLTGARYTWRGPRNYVELNPHVLPAHIFRVGRSR